uniref:Uncharacterized protein n=1 Tax=Timema genevievae TaxID=629358 RepID=A0A7R9JVK2_TIMGE|nr:unnamed protein product [Timema genevievae]
MEHHNNDILNSDTTENRSFGSSVSDTSSVSKPNSEWSLLPFERHRQVASSRTFGILDTLTPMFGVVSFEKCGKIERAFFFKNKFLVEGKKLTSKMSLYNVLKVGMLVSMDVVPGDNKAEAKFKATVVEVLSVENLARTINKQYTSQPPPHFDATYSPAEETSNSHENNSNGSSNLASSTNLGKSEYSTQISGQTGIVLIFFSDSIGVLKYGKIELAFHKIAIYHLRNEPNATLQSFLTVGQVVHFNAIILGTLDSSTILITSIWVGKKPKQQPDVQIDCPISYYNSLFKLEDVNGDVLTNVDEVDSLCQTQLQGADLIESKQKNASVTYVRGCCGKIKSYLSVNRGVVECSSLGTDAIFHRNAVLDQEFLRNESLEHVLPVGSVVCFDAKLASSRAIYITCLWRGKKYHKEYVSERTNSETLDTLKIEPALKTPEYIYGTSGVVISYISDDEGIVEANLAGRTRSVLFNKNVVCLPDGLVCLQTYIPLCSIVYLDAQILSSGDILVTCLWNRREPKNGSPHSFDLLKMLLDQTLDRSKTAPPIDDSVNVASLESNMASNASLSNILHNRSGKVKSYNSEGEGVIEFPIEGKIKDASFHKNVVCLPHNFNNLCLEEYLHQGKQVYFDATLTEPGDYDNITITKVWTQKRYSKGVSLPTSNVILDGMSPCAENKAEQIHLVKDSAVATTVPLVPRSSRENNTEISQEELDLFGSTSFDLVQNDGANEIKQSLQNNSDKTLEAASPPMESAESELRQEYVTAGDESNSSHMSSEGTCLAGGALKHKGLKELTCSDHNIATSFSPTSALGFDTVPHLQLRPEKPVVKNSPRDSPRKLLVTLTGWSSKVSHYISVDEGVLEVRPSGSGEKVQVSFHRSVVYVSKEDENRMLQSIIPAGTNVNYDAVINSNGELHITSLWVGKKPRVSRDGGGASPSLSNVGDDKTIDPSLQSETKPFAKSFPLVLINRSAIVREHISNVEAIVEYTLGGTRYMAKFHKKLVYFPDLVKQPLKKYLPIGGTVYFNANLTRPGDYSNIIITKLWTGKNSEIKNLHRVAGNIGEVTPSGSSPHTDNSSDPVTTASTTSNVESTRHGASDDTQLCHKMYSQAVGTGGMSFKPMETNIVLKSAHKVEAKSTVKTNERLGGGSTGLSETLQPFQATLKKSAITKTTNQNETVRSDVLPKYLLNYCGIVVYYMSDIEGILEFRVNNIGLRSEFNRNCVCLPPGSNLSLKEYLPVGSSANFDANVVTNGASRCVQVIRLWTNNGYSDASIVRKKMGLNPDCVYKGKITQVLTKCFLVNVTENGEDYGVTVANQKFSHARHGETLDWKELMERHVTVGESVFVRVSREGLETGSWAGEECWKMVEKEVNEMQTELPVKVGILAYVFEDLGVLNEEQAHLGMFFRRERQRLKFVKNLESKVSKVFFGSDLDTCDEYDFEDRYAKLVEYCSAQNIVSSVRKQLVKNLSLQSPVAGNTNGSTAGDIYFSSDESSGSYESSTSASSKNGGPLVKLSVNGAKDVEPTFCAEDECRTRRTTKQTETNNNWGAKDDSYEDVFARSCSNLRNENSCLASASYLSDWHIDVSHIQTEHADINGAETQETEALAEGVSDSSWFEICNIDEMRFASSHEVTKREEESHVPGTTDAVVELGDVLSTVHACVLKALQARGLEDVTSPESLVSEVMSTLQSRFGHGGDVSRGTGGGKDGAKKVCVERGSQTISTGSILYLDYLKRL